MSNEMKLYEIADRYLALEKELIDLQHDEQTIADTLESEAGDLEEKAVAVAKVARNFEASADSIEEAAKAMKERAERIRKRSEWLKNYLLDNMLRTGISEVSCEYFAIKTRKKPPRVDIEDTRQIPVRFLLDPPPQEKRIDKVGIRKAIQGGEEVPGAVLRQGYRLEIK